MNSITLQGQIKSIYEGKKHTIVTLFIKSRRPNYPQIVFSQSRRQIVSDFAEGDYVKISGLLKTRGERQDSGKILHHQFIRGEDIIFMDEPTDDTPFDFKNEGELMGRIVRSTADKNMVTLLVRPDGEQFNVWAFIYTDTPEEDAEKFAEGQVISAKCEMQTVRKEIRGEAKFFENFVVQEAETR